MIQEFKQLIEGDTRLHMLFTAMFDEIPQKKPYNMDLSGEKKQIRDYEHMLKVFNHLIELPPAWTTNAEQHGTVGLPINAILDGPAGTPSGYAAFLEPQVNAMLKKVLNVWGDFLSSSRSLQHLALAL